MRFHDAERRCGQQRKVRNLQTSHATRDDDDVRLTVRVSQTWVKVDGRWQIAGIQFSPMAAA